MRILLSLKLCCPWSEKLIRREMNLTELPALLSDAGLEPTASTSTSLQAT